MWFCSRTRLSGGDPGARIGRGGACGGRARGAVGRPSSLLLALMGSGLNGQKLRHGYLPIDAAAAAEIKRLESESKAHAQTQLFIETPYRNMQLLDTLSKPKCNTNCASPLDLTCRLKPFVCTRVGEGKSV